MTELNSVVQRFLQPNEKCRVAIETRYSKTDGKDFKKLRILAIVQEEQNHEFGVLILKRSKKTVGLFTPAESIPFYSDLMVQIAQELIINIEAPWIHKSFSFQVISKEHIHVFLCEISSFFSSIADSSKSVKRDSYLWITKYQSLKNAQTSKPTRVVSLLDASEYHSGDFRLNMAPTEGSKSEEAKIDVRLRLKEREEEYTEIKSVRISICTWNVNSRLPEPGSMAKILQVASEPSDIIVVGLQEIDMSAEALLLNDVSKGKPWESLLVSDINSGEARYQMLTSRQMTGVFLIVFVRRELAQFVSNLQVEIAAVGLMGIMGNKGGIAVRFRLYDTSICFVNSHLAAHQENFARRNEDFHEISRRIRFVEQQEEYSILDHDLSYWLGDLNYRINLPDEEIRRLCLDKNYSVLWEYDQLKIQMGLGNSFQSYEEAPLQFAPTYKYDPGTDNYDSSEKKRSPAYCDRVLWKKDSKSRILSYLPGTNAMSDHRPVVAIFNSDIKAVNEQKRTELFHDIAKNADKYRNESMPDTVLSSHSVNFKNIYFGVPCTESIEIQNTGSVVARFCFISGTGDKSICKPWLTVHPRMGTLPVGSKVKITFTVYVTCANSPVLNSGREKLEDTLILSLIHGKHHFITIEGNYQRSCFGMSLEELVRIHQPVRTLTNVNLTAVSEPLETPKELWRMVDYLSRYALDQNRIFISNGIPAEMDEIRESLDTNKPFPPGISPHSVAETLLFWLQSLVEPIIPTPLYIRCLEQSDKPAHLRQLLQALPRLHHNTFVYIISFLSLVLQHQQKNGVSVEELAMVFGNVLLRPPTTMDESASEDISTRKQANVILQLLKLFAPFVAQSSSH